MITQRKSRASDQLVITASDAARLWGIVDSSHFQAIQPQLTAALRRELTRGTVIRAREMAGNVVTMRSKVRVRDMRTQEHDTYVLVYPEEADIDEGRLSVLAPLGTALLGAAEGQVVEFKAPAGTRRLKVERILYQPEAAGDFHL